MKDEENFNIAELRSRLLSIIYDRCYLETNVAPKVPANYKIIPNERCGNWYAPKKDVSCYFKSTDGHKDHWNFNYRRLNLHILTELIENEGIVIVDSSKYKQIPDSLSKTIPIWCSVLSLIINEIYFTETDGSIDSLKFNELSSFLLELPIQLKSIEAEYESILKLLPSFYNISKKFHPHLNAELKSLGFDSQKTKTVIHLKPFWIYPDVEVFNLQEKKMRFKELPVETYKIILCSASEYKHISRHHKMIKYQPDKIHNKYDICFNYFQGAGDDHELWDMKLDPNSFNDNIKIIENLLIEEKSDDIHKLVKFLDTLSPLEDDCAKDFECINVSSNIFITTNDMIKHANLNDFHKIICFGSADNIEFPAGSILFPKMSDDKKGIRLFFSHVKDIDNDIFCLLAKNKSKKILISSEKYELNIGAALIILAKYDREAFKIGNLDKVKLRQLFISVCNKTEANINTSRLLLNKINGYIISGNYK